VWRCVFVVVILISATRGTTRSESCSNPQKVVFFKQSPRDQTEAVKKTPFSSDVHFSDGPWTHHVWRTLPFIRGIPADRSDHETLHRFLWEVERCLVLLFLFIYCFYLCYCFIDLWGISCVSSMFRLVNTQKLKTLNPSGHTDGTINKAYFV